MSLVPVFQDTSLLPPELVERARSYAEQARSPSTWAKYTQALRTFEGWCRERRLVALPAEGSTVALYLAFLADQGRKVSTVELHLSALSALHRAAGFHSPRKDPEVAAVRAGIRRVKGVARKQSPPLLPGDLQRMAAAAGDDLMGKRARAVLLLGFAGAFRRSELVSLDVEDLQPTEEGLTITLRRSKTDPEGEGTLVGIPRGAEGTCPVQAVQEWREAARIGEGPLFRSLPGRGEVGGRMCDRTVDRIVRTTARRAGLGPFSAHSLRAGLCTAAAMAGHELPDIMRQSRHRSLVTLLGYIRKGSVFRDNAAKGLL